MSQTTTMTMPQKAVVASPSTSPTHLPTSSEVVDPSTSLPFNISTLKSAIPAHCFEKNLATSIYYLVRDFAFIGVLYAIYPLVCQYGDSLGLAKFAWWNVLGFFGWCLFVVGHDCGHRTFSTSVELCDLFGHIAHTPLLVPFHGWRISHREHHLNHNHVEHDHTWRPIGKSNYLLYLAENMQARISKVLRFSHALLVLYPIYLITDSDFTSGNHFNPYSRLFAKEERTGAMISTACIVTWLTFLFVKFPLLTLLDAYFMPYIFFICWLDLVTYLHHTDPSLTYYRGSSWSYLKGALSTIDRSYGSIIDHLHHNIGTHMIHHMFFTAIPHYHLLDATEALKPVLGEHYKLDTTPIVSAYVKSKEACHWVKDDGEVLRYQSHEDLMNGEKTE